MTLPEACSFLQDLTQIPATLLSGSRQQALFCHAYQFHPVQNYLNPDTLSYFLAHLNPSQIVHLTDPLGIHARPAGLLVKAVKALDSTVTIEKVGGKSAPANKLMALMGVGVKQGDTVVVTIEGGDEEASFQAMEQFFKENLK